MSTSKRTITKLQLFFLVTQATIGITLLELPYRLHKYAKGDAWIAVLIAGVFIQIFIFIHYLLVKRFPDKTIFEFVPDLLGKWLGKVVVLGYAAYFLLVTATIVVMFANVIHTWVLLTTPRWVIILLLLLPCLYMAKDSLTVIARFFALVSGTTLILIGLSMLTYENVDVRFIFPIGDSGLKNILLGSKEATFSLLGFETLLFSYALIERKKQGVVKTMTLAHLFIIVLYTYITFTVLISFTPTELPLVPEPVLYMIKYLTFTVIERLDLFFISIWVYSAATSVILYLYASSRAMATAFNLKKHTKLVPVICMIIFFIAVKNVDINQREKLDQISTQSSYFFVFILPIVLLLLSFFKKKKQKQGGKQK